MGHYLKERLLRGLPMRQLASASEAPCGRGRRGDVSALEDESQFDSPRNCLATIASIQFEIEIPGVTFDRGG